MRDYEEKSFDGGDMTRKSEKELEKIVKDRELLQSLDLLLQMLELAGHCDEQVISASSKLQDPQQVLVGVAVFFF